LIRCRRYSVEFAVIMMDIDHFKLVNDSHGHHVGDEVLQAMAQILRERTRDADALARLGGEEFVIVCRHSKIQAAVETAERIRAAIASHHFPGVGQATASFGVAACCEGDTTEHLLERADAALYRAKNGGRNRVEADHK